MRSTQADARSLAEEETVRSKSLTMRPYLKNIMGIQVLRISAKKKNMLKLALSTEFQQPSPMISSGAEKTTE